MKTKYKKEQVALDKYKRKFDTFMASLEKQVLNDKSFRKIKGNMFCAIIQLMKQDINSFLKVNKVAKR